MHAAEATGMPPEQVFKTQLPVVKKQESMFFASLFAVNWI